MDNRGGQFKENLMMILNTVSFFVKKAVRQERVYVFIIFFKIVINCANKFVGLYTTKLIVGEIAGRRELEKLVFLVLIILIVNMFTAFCDKLLVENLNRIGDKLERTLMLDLNKVIMQMNYDNTENPVILAQIHKAKKAISEYSGGVVGLSNCIIDSATAIILGAGTTIIVCESTPIIAVIITIEVGIGIFVNIISNRYKREYFENNNRLERRYLYYALEMLNRQYAKDIRLYNAYEIIRSKSWREYSDITDERLSLNKKVVKITNRNSMVSGICMIFIMLVLAHKVFIKIIGIDDFVMCYNASRTMKMEVTNLIVVPIDLYQICFYLKEYVVLISQLEKENKCDNESVIDEITDICFENVWFRYPRTEKWILQGFNMEIKKGEHIAIVGFNGEGKTTIVKLLCRLYTVSKGAIYVNGININKIECKSYLKCIATMFQDIKLFETTIRKNIVLNNYGKSNEELSEYVKFAGLQDKINQLRKGIDTYAGKQFDVEGIEPSGGEAQKIALLRTINKDGDLIILDEPTSELDPIIENEICEKFSALIKGKTALIVSHRLSVCRFCEKIIVVKEGKIAEQGSHNELMLINSGLYRNMFETQAKYYEL